MAASRDPAQRDRTLARLGSGKLTLEEMAALAFAAISDPLARDPAWQYIVAHLDEVMAALPFLIRPAVVQFAAPFCDAEHRAALDTVFRPKLENVPGGAKQLGEIVERLDLCIARREKFGPDVAAFLARQ
jgi:hypothetical protein